MSKTREHLQALDRLVAICTGRGGRMTRQRKAVLDVLLAAERPMSAYDLRDALLPEDGAITPASVYRCLDYLMEHGLVHRLEKTRAFVACGHADHAHAVQFLICRQCGVVVEAEDKRVAAATVSLGERLGFEVDQRTVELTGLCGTCRKDGAAAGAGPR